MHMYPIATPKRRFIVVCVRLLFHVTDSESERLFVAGGLDIANDTGHESVPQTTKGHESVPQTTKGHEYQEGNGVGAEVDGSS